MRSGYSSRILEMSRVPMPEPVPPPRECVSWNPCKQSQPSASLRTTSRTESTSSAPSVPTLAKHEVVRSENLSKWTRSHGVHGARLQVHKNGTWHIFTTRSLVVVYIDALQLEVTVTVNQDNDLNHILGSTFYQEDVAPVVLGVQQYTLCLSNKCPYGMFTAQHNSYCSVEKWMLDSSLVLSHHHLRS
ncbi:hypothetical protein B566_EDAN010811 [Ephemera danica]|nr:hypothetical protein B566_EDAN010811 [Ephemera danica]